MTYCALLVDTFCEKSQSHQNAKKEKYSLHAKSVQLEKGNLIDLINHPKENVLAVNPVMNVHIVKLLCVLIFASNYFTHKKIILKNTFKL